MTYGQDAQQQHDQSLEAQLRRPSQPEPQPEPTMEDEAPETEEGSERLEALRRLRTRLSSRARPVQTQTSSQQQSDMQPPSAST